MAAEEEPAKTVIYAPVPPVAIVPPVPYWSYWVLPLIICIQTLGVAYFGMRAEQNKKEIHVAVDETKESVVVLEKQINSNLEKQIQASIEKAIANERLRVAGLQANDAKSQAKEVAGASEDMKKEKERLQQEKKK